MSASTELFIVQWARGKGSSPRSVEGSSRAMLSTAWPSYINCVATTCWWIEIVNEVNWLCCRYFEMFLRCHKIWNETVKEWEFTAWKWEKRECHKPDLVTFTCSMHIRLAIEDIIWANDKQVRPIYSQLLLQVVKLIPSKYLKSSCRLFHGWFIGY